MELDRLLYLALAAPFVYLAAYQMIQWISDSGLPVRLLRKYILPYRTLAAHLHGKARLADRLVYQSYLGQLATGSDSERDIALQYLSQLPATRDLADTLIQVLAHVSRSEFRARLLQLLRDTLSHLERHAHNPGQGVDRRRAWHRASAVWLAELSLAGLSASWFTQLSIGPFLLISLLALVVALAPLLPLVQDSRSIVRLGMLIVAIGLGLLWWFSDATHAGEDRTPRRPMAVYGFEGVDVQISYPRWLTVNDIEDCASRIVVTAFGQGGDAPAQIEVSFPYADTELFFGDHNCHPISPAAQLDTTTPAGDPKELSVKPLKRESLNDRSVTLTPLIRDPARGAPPLPAADLEFTIRYEDPVWQTIRDLCGIGGATSFTVFLASAINWYRKQP